MRHLHPIHKKCYRVLKYLLTHGTYFNRPIKDISLSSYVFKTAVLFHEYEKLCSGTPDIVTCCIEIIRYVRVKLRQGVFPPFLMRTTNVWGQCYKIPVPHGWRPADLNREISSFDWCFILWFQLWRQFLGKALTIFQRIKMKLQMEEPETSDSITLLGKASLNTMSQTHDLVAYIPNKYDPFLAEFAVLREDAFVITAEYSRRSKYAETVSMVSRCPSEETWQLVLPKFPEYLSQIESVCGREVSIPKNVSKTLDLKSSSEQIFFRKLSLGAPEGLTQIWVKMSSSNCVVMRTNTLVFSLTERACLLFRIDSPKSA